MESFNIFQVGNQNLRQKKQNTQKTIKLAKAKFSYLGHNKIFFLAKCECNQILFFD